MAQNRTQSQFIILAIVVAMATYVGTVARGVATKIGAAHKEGRPASPKHRLQLGSLIVADALLMAIAALIGIRILIILSGYTPQQGLDIAILAAIGSAISYMVALHAIQWGLWAWRIARRPPNAPGGVTAKA